MKRLTLVALLALAGCEHIDGYEAAGVVAAGLGAAAGTFGAHLAQGDSAPVVAQVEPEPDGGALVDWADAGGPCSAAGDRVCCTPEALSALLHRDGGR